MTRANINYINPDNKDKEIQFFYWNGDQYPQGIRDYYNVLDFINSDMSQEAFEKWAKTNYEGIEIETVDQPKIYYTGWFITDYSYVFDVKPWSEPSILVYNWTELIFSGNQKNFKKWLNKQG